MQKLNLPEYTFKITEKNGVKSIFDEVRKKYLVLTPEEWVRQNLIAYLVVEKKYPIGLISLEAGLKLNSLQKRYDSLVFDKKGSPLVLVECKAPEVKISKNVFEQILAYNRTINAPYLLISNGLSHYFLKRGENNQFVFESGIPEYSKL